MKRIYVAGPYTKGDVAVNVRNAILAANELRGHGFFPYVPHLSHYWHTLCPCPYEDWLAIDIEWLSLCDALVRLPGDSSGADKEVKWAKDHGLPVFFGVTAFLKDFLNESLDDMNSLR